MPNTPKSNRLKRKRGKKFVYRDPNSTAPSAPESSKVNPFEEHSKSKKFVKDLEKR
jgi:hypothetical protein